jgi:hypothetical protein
MFKPKYLRHTQFEVESIEIPIKTFQFGKATAVSISKNGDLCYRLPPIQLPALYTYNLYADVDKIKIMEIISNLPIKL